MKFVLFIGISLLVNMFHATAMPVSMIDHMPLEVATDAAQPIDRHHAHMTADDLKSNNHCPDNNSPCCLVLALPPSSSPPSPDFSGQERYLSFSPRHAKRTRVAPFRPPKFYLS